MLDGTDTDVHPACDLAQVEVVRGPQGTLYGSSSVGGTIKLVTNKPKLGKWEASGASMPMAQRL